MRYILLDSIRSMQNVWAIFRNCDGSWFDKVILTWFTPVLPRGEINKTAIWAENYIDWEYYKDPLEVVNKLKKEGFKIVSVELDKRSIDYKTFKVSNDDKICLIMGNELSWVSEKLLKISDEIVMIPMLGHKASLNVSVAAWIVMYQLVN